jgi:hypothetical protein
VCGEAERRRASATEEACASPTQEMNGWRPAAVAPGVPNPKRGGRREEACAGLDFFSYFELFLIIFQEIN